LTLNPSATTIRLKAVVSYVAFSLITFSILAALFIDLYGKRLNENLQGRLDFMLNEIVEHQMHTQSIEWLKHYFHVGKQENRPELEDYISRLNMEFLKKAPPEQAGYLQSSRMLPDGRWLALRSATDRLEHARNVVFWEIVGVFGIALLLSSGIFIAYLYKLFHPMDCLVRFCRSFSHDRALLPVCNGSSEIEELRDAIVQLLQTNASLVEQEHDLFREAAHELKSPLAVLKARLDLLKSGQYEQGQFIQEANEDIDKIIEHLKELLFLKSVERVMFGMEQELDLFNEIESVISEFRILLEKKSLHISYGSRLSFKIRSNSMALNKILKAVMENVIHHSANESIIYINLQPTFRSVDFINMVSKHPGEQGMFSSHIGLKSIERFSQKLGFICESGKTEGSKFRTTLRFSEGE